MTSDSSKAKQWRKDNPGENSKLCRLWRAKNRLRNRLYEQEYLRKHPEVRLAKAAKRRATKLKACPDYDFGDKFNHIYKQAEEKRKQTGQEWHVDHIEPLQGDDRCGLHVPYNLQVILAEENLSKSNKPPSEFYGYSAAELYYLLDDSDVYVNITR